MTTSRQKILEKMEADHREWLVGHVAGALPALTGAAGEDALAMAELVVDGNGMKNVAAIRLLRRRVHDFLLDTDSEDGFEAAVELGALLQSTERTIRAAPGTLH